ncbi:hypothetical protein CW304_04315 [Bacillus sp. UFRGS-B20]|nr:hypothetical protein CW304_04315 [Bacillus sp. UFRGS-B20]
MVAGALGLRQMQEAIVRAGVGKVTRLLIVIMFRNGVILQRQQLYHREKMQKRINEGGSGQQSIF